MSIIDQNFVTPFFETTVQLRVERVPLNFLDVQLFEKIQQFTQEIRALLSQNHFTNSILQHNVLQKLERQCLSLCFGMGMAAMNFYKSS